MADVWFDDMVDQLPLSTEDTKAVAIHVSRLLLPGQNIPLPQRLKNDTAPRIVFISTSDGKRSASVHIGAAKGIATALEQALDAVMEAKKDSTINWVKVDVVAGSTLIGYQDFTKALPIDANVNGLAFGQRSRIALLPGELTGRGIVDNDRMIKPLLLIGYLKSRISNDESSKFKGLGDIHRVSYRFTTDGFIATANATTPKPLYRGHRFYDEQITNDQAMEAANIAGNYMAHAIYPDGRFIYLYHAHKNQILNSYSLSRHASSLSRMMELHSVAPKKQLLDSSKLAISYLLQQLRQMNTKTLRGFCVVDENHAQLGPTSQALLAIAQYTKTTGDKRYLGTAKQIGRWILGLQQPNGRFIHKVTFPDGFDTKRESWFYPGEALLALLRLYEVDPDQRWLDAVVRNVKYRMSVLHKDANDEQLSHQFYFVVALNELYRHRRERPYIDHAIELATIMMKSQNDRSKRIDWEGGFHVPPHINITATRCEAFRIAAAMAESIGDHKRATEFVNAMDQGIRFIMRCQIAPEQAMYLRYPTRVLGAFRSDLDHYHIRIDYAQHCIGSLLSWRKMKKD